MIVDVIGNASLYFGINDGIKKGLEYLQDNDLTIVENGKYEIDGTDVYVIVQEYDSKVPDGVKWEAHKKYIDIRYIIAGSEKLGYANVADFVPTTEYDEAKDIVFGDGCGSFITAKQGDFIIFTTNDAHMPSICVDEPTYVKKAVVKVKAQ